MAKTKNTKLVRLLKELRRRGSMTHKQMVQFLLRGTGLRYSEATRRYYDGALYDTRGSNYSRYGLLTNFCEKNADGSYSLRKYVTLSGPVTDSFRYTPVSYL